MARQRELLKSGLDSLLITLIAQKPMYGYQIIKELGKRSEGYFEFKEGTLYPALHRLERAGWATARWQMLPSGQQRKYYHITNKGLRVLVERRNEWRDFLMAVNLIIQPVRDARGSCCN